MRNETQQRTLILGIVRSSPEHPTADEVFMQARKEMPRLSLGTVYRNLKLLAQEGLIKEIHFGSGPARYDGNGEPHAHFVCEGCGQVDDLSWPLPPQLVGSVEERLRVQITKQRLDFYGLCAACQPKQKLGGRK